MEVQNPQQLALAANVTALLADVDAELVAFRALGAFPPEVQAEIQRSFLPERISDTLNIEGIRVNPRITRAILEGLTLAESDRYTEQEVLNVIAANELIESDARDRMPLTVDLIRELHRRVEDTLIPTAGSLRDQDVSITGAVQQPPHWADLRDLLLRLCQLYELTVDVHPLARGLGTCHLHRHSSLHGRQWTHRAAPPGFRLDLQRIAPCWHPRIQT